MKKYILFLVIILLPSLSFSNGFKNLEKNDAVFTGVLDSIILQDYCKKTLKEQAPETLKLYKKSKTNKSLGKYLDTFSDEKFAELDKEAEKIIENYGQLGCMVAYGYIHGIIAAEAQ